MSFIQTVLQYLSIKQQITLPDTGEPGIFRIHNTEARKKTKIKHQEQTTQSGRQCWISDIKFSFQFETALQYGGNLNKIKHFCYKKRTTMPNKVCQRVSQFKASKTGQEFRWF